MEPKQIRLSSSYVTSGSRQRWSSISLMVIHHPRYRSAYSIIIFYINSRIPFYFPQEKNLYNSLPTSFQHRSDNIPIQLMYFVIVNVYSVFAVLINKHCPPVSSFLLAHCAAQFDWTLVNGSNTETAGTNFLPPFARDTHLQQS